MKKSYNNLVVLFCLFLYPVFTFGGTHQFENGKIEIAISTKKEYDTKQYPLEKSIVSFINGATKTLDMAVQEIRKCLKRIKQYSLSAKIAEDALKEYKENEK